MSKRETPLYQGRDWFSYRWTIAQAFDSLDHIHDICLHHDRETASALSSDEDSLLTYFEDICALLGTRLSLAFADTAPSRIDLACFSHEWLCFEARQVFASLRDKVPEILAGSKDEFQQIMNNVTSLKDYLKKIDT